MKTNRTVNLAPQRNDRRDSPRGSEKRSAKAAKDAGQTGGFSALAEMPSFDAVDSGSAPRSAVLAAHREFSSFGFRADPAP